MKSWIYMFRCRDNVTVHHRHNIKERKRKKNRMNKYVAHTHTHYIRHTIQYYCYWFIWCCCCYQVINLWPALDTLVSCQVRSQADKLKKSIFVWMFLHMVFAWHRVHERPTVQTEAEQKSNEITARSTATSARCTLIATHFEVEKHWRITTDRPNDRATKSNFCKITQRTINRIYYE